METSLRTIERGLAENICLDIVKQYERYSHVKTNINAWYSKRDASWNVNCYRGSGTKDSSKANICRLGKSSDFHAACEALRLNYFNSMTELCSVGDSPFTSFYEIDLWIDDRDKAKRNKVGALDDDALPTVEYSNNGVSVESVIKDFFVKHKELSDEIMELKIKLSEYKK
jgi:hypothetical protein